MSRIRIGLAQINTTVGDLSGNVERIVAALEEAKSLGVDLVAFPELALTGYPPEDLLLKPAFVEANRTALESVARRTEGIAAVVGFVDRDTDLYNAAAVLADGTVVGVYHKERLPKMEPRRKALPGCGGAARSRARGSGPICESRARRTVRAACRWRDRSSHQLIAVPSRKWRTGSGCGIWAADYAVAVAYVTRSAGRTSWSSTGTGGLRPDGHRRRRRRSQKSCRAHELAGVPDSIHDRRRRHLVTAALGMSGTSPVFALPVRPYRPDAHDDVGEVHQAPPTRTTCARTLQKVSLASGIPARRASPWTRTGRESVFRCRATPPKELDDAAACQGPDRAASIPTSPCSPRR